MGWQSGWGLGSRLGVGWMVGWRGWEVRFGGRSGVVGVGWGGIRVMIYECGTETETYVIEIKKIKRKSADIST